MHAPNLLVGVHPLEEVAAQGAHLLGRENVLDDGISLLLQVPHKLGGVDAVAAVAAAARRCSCLHGEERLGSFGEFGAGLMGTFMAISASQYPRSTVLGRRRVIDFEKTRHKISKRRVTEIQLA